MIRRLLATTGCAAAAVALVGLPATAQPIAATPSVATAAYHQVLEVGAPPRKCAPNYTQGTIGGVSKCLAAGQQCQQAQAAAYTKYGFRCSLVGKRYQLTKTTTARPGLIPHPRVPAKPAPTKPAPTKPAPAPTHH